MTAPALDRVARSIQHYGFADPERQAWSGPVERRDPASYRCRSVVQTWMCVNAFCRQWTMHGSYLTGRCCFCQTPRP